MITEFDEYTVGNVVVREAKQSFTAGEIANRAALAELARVDRETGMNRLLRETLLAIAGAAAPAKLAEAETKAAIERGKLK